MKLAEKLKARTLRKDGRSIKEIARLLDVSKASVSVWVRDIVLSPKKKKELFSRGWASEIIEKRRERRLANESKKRQKISDEGGKEIVSISRVDLKLIGLILYWAEGGKTKRGMVRIANSDPAMIKVAMRFFREVCGVKEEKFRGHIHTHSHFNIKNSLKYWSDVASIPTSQFFKTYAKPSIASKGKRDSLPYGTLDVIICDTNLFLRIMGMIEKIKKLSVL